MSFETFAVAVVILLVAVAVVCISLGYAGKKDLKKVVERMSLRKSCNVVLIAKLSFVLARLRIALSKNYKAVLIAKLSVVLARLRRALSKNYKIVSATR